MKLLMWIASFAAAPSLAAGGRSSVGREQIPGICKEDMHHLFINIVPKWRKCNVNSSFCKLSTFFTI